MKKGRLALVDSHKIDYCNDYHCAGDCGLPHSQAEYLKHFTPRGRAEERKRLTLAAFDSLALDDSRKLAEEKSAVQQKARDLL
jgi:hypothetical protein